MKKFNLFFLASLLTTLLVLSTIVPAWAISPQWTRPEQYPPPPAYAATGRVYTRTQWMRFYINYGGYNLGRTGQYAVPVGGYYALCFGLLSDPNSGWSAVEKHPQLPPASGTPISGDVRLWLDGFLGLNSQLETSDYWLCSPAFLTGQQIPLPGGLFASGAWPISTNPEGSNQKLDVLVYVGTRLPDGSAPPVDPVKNTTTRPLCIKNGPDIFEAGATTVNGKKTRYVWCGFASSEPAGGQPPLGNVNLTQEAAGQVVGRVFDGPLGFTGRYMSSGYVTASFPYNVAVLNVTKANDDGANAYYDWQVVNPTPLWLHGITVRVYTHGKQTGKWNLVAVYHNVDIPPAALDGKIKGSPNNKDITVSASGVYAIAQPRLYTKVPKPSEPYDVVVTANVDLAIQNGQMGTPVINQGLRATYWNGAIPNGLPSNEVPGTQLFDRSQSVLGRTLQNPFGDNVASTSDSGYWPPGPPPEPPPGGNLTALGVTADLSGKASADFSSTFDIGGWAVVRFYREDKTGIIQQVGDKEYIYFSPGGKVTVTKYNLGFRDGDTVWAAINMFYSSGQWAVEQFKGDDGKNYDESTYADNKISCTVGQPPPPPPSGEVHPTTYPVYEKISVYRTEYEKRWVGEVKRVPLEEKPSNAKVRVRLVE